MATKLYHTDLSTDLTRPYLVPVVSPSNNAEQVPLETNIIIKIPISTAAENTAKGGSPAATAVVDKSAFTVDIPDGTDFISDTVQSPYTGKLTIDDDGDELGNGVGTTVQITAMEIAVIPVGEAEIVWTSTTFNTVSKTIAGYNDGTVPDLVRVTFTINPRGGASSTHLTPSTSISIGLDDALETDVYTITFPASESESEQ